VSQLTSETLFEASVVDVRGCEVLQDTVRILVESETLNFIPTAFTPNEDGENDFFTFEILGASSADVRIFDRYGKEVWNQAAQLNFTEGGTNGWDGKDLDGNNLPIGTYIYELMVDYLNGDREKIYGSISIVR